jgi:hypothetical protein
MDRRYAGARSISRSFPNAGKPQERFLNDVLGGITIVDEETRQSNEIGSR